MEEEREKMRQDIRDKVSRIRWDGFWKGSSTWPKKGHNANYDNEDDEEQEREEHLGWFSLRFRRCHRLEFFLDTSIALSGGRSMTWSNDDVWEYAGE